MVKHVRKGSFQLQRFLYFFGCYIRIFAVLKETWPLMVTEKLYYCINVCLPIFRKSFEVYEYSRDACAVKQGNRIFHVLIKISVKNSLVHKVQAGTYIKQYPTEIMELKWCKNIGTAFNSSFNGLT